jgi:hypothetical protein
MSETTKHITNSFVATVGVASPRSARFLGKGLNDAERGEVTVATVVWAALAITLAVAVGVILLRAVTTKANTVEGDLQKANA